MVFFKDINQYLFQMQVLENKNEPLENIAVTREFLVSSNQEFIREG